MHSHSFTLFIIPRCQFIGTSTQCLKITQKVSYFSKQTYRVEQKYVDTLILFHPVARFARNVANETF